MPHISRVPLKKEVERELVEVLLDSLVAIDRKEFAREVVADLFTPTEKIMLAKRFLIAMLLEEGYGYLEITRVLHVTPSTINQVKITLAKSGRGFRALAGLLRGSRKAAHVIERLRLPAKSSKR